MYDNLKERFFAWINKQDPDAEIFNFHLGRASWANCAVGKFFQEEFNVPVEDMHDYDVSAFYVGRIEKVLDVSMFAYLEKGAFDTYGQLQEYIKVRAL